MLGATGYMSDYTLVSRYKFKRSLNVFDHWSNVLASLEDKLNESATKDGERL